MAGGDTASLVSPTLVQSKDISVADAHYQQHGEFRTKGKGEKSRISSNEVLGCCHCAASVIPPKSCKQPPLRAGGARQPRSRDTHHPVPALRQVGTASAWARFCCLYVCSLLMISKVTVTLSKSSHQVSSQTQTSGQKAGTPWESAPNACEQAAGLISLLALLCQLITGLSGTLMHAPLTAIQLSSLLRTAYQYICSYIFPEISRRCKELPTGDGFGSRRAVQANSAAEKSLSVGAI